MRSFVRSSFRLSVVVLAWSLLRPGTASSQVWTEGPDADSLPQTAQLPVGCRDLRTISGVLSYPDVDMFEVFLTGTTGFSAFAQGIYPMCGNVQLHLFDSAGRGVYANDNVSPPPDPMTVKCPGAAMLPSDHLLTPVKPGRYLLAVSAPWSEPVSAGGAIFPCVSCNPGSVVGPTGPGGNEPVTGWSGPVFGSGGYTISLTGAQCVATTGATWAWGYNSNGQLGDGSNTDRLTPVATNGISDAVALAAGQSHSLALGSGGGVRAWGSNYFGALGDGTTTNRWTPVAVSGLTNVAALAAGWRHSMAVRVDGTAWTWGNNEFGQLGDGTTTNRSTPVPVSGLTNVAALAGGEHHSLALRNDGTVWAWGGNEFGQLGDGTTASRLTPAAVVGLTNVVAVAANGLYSLALRSDGTVRAWGYNGNGELGDGTTTDRWTPVAVSGLAGVAAIAAGHFHGLALRSDGTVWAWGSGPSGQLGDGTTATRLTPVAVSGLTNVVTIAGSWSHSVALRSDGTVWAWGDNWHGALGDGTTTDRWTPALVSGLVNAIAIAAGDDYTLAAVMPPVLDPILEPLRIGGPNTLNGTGFTPGTVIKLYVATAGGAVSYGPYVPQSWGATSLTWVIPSTVPLGNGFGSVQVVNTDQGYTESNIVGSLLEGDPLDNIPTILYLNGEPLGPADPSIGVAHIDTVIAKGSTVTITGMGFNNPGVNLFTATGNVGPLWPIGGWTESQVQVQVPVTAPTGPGNFQVVNTPYTGNVASNAVSAVIGARPTITSVSVVDTTATVTGSGFCSLSVINLFNLQGAVVVNLGGLNGTTAKVPLTIVNDTQFTFTLPAGAVAGPAFVEVLNPPYIPYASSGDDPDGAFTIPLQQ